MKKNIEFCVNNELMQIIILSVHHAIDKDTLLTVKESRS